jgi:hypothetical protein
MFLNSKWYHDTQHAISYHINMENNDTENDEIHNDDMTNNGIYNISTTNKHI